MPAARPTNTRAKQRQRKPGTSSGGGGGPSGTGRPTPRIKVRVVVVPPPRGDVGTGQGYRKQAPVRRVADPKGVDLPRTKRYVAQQRQRGHEAHDTKGAADLRRGRAQSEANIREARLRYLRRTNKPVTTLRAEIEGRGLINKGVENLIHLYKNDGAIATTGGGPTIGARVTPGGHFAFGGPTAAATPLRPGLQKPSKFAANLLRDIVETPLLAIPAAYTVAAAGVEAAQGDTKRAKQVGKGLASGVIGHLLQGDLKGAGKAAEEHPLFALQELRGAKAIVGRGTGAAMRAVPGPTREIATTRRADLPLGHGRLADRQHYSPDVLTKAAQVMVERHGPRRPTAGRLRTRADMMADQASGASRNARQEELVAARKALPTRSGNRVGQAVDRALPAGRGLGKVAPRRLTRPEQDIVPLVMQRVVRHAGTVKADLEKELGRLNTEYKNRAQFRTGTQASANRRQAQAVARVLKDPKALANVEGITRSADTLIRRTTALETKAIERHGLDSEAAARSKLFPYAQTHMGARYGGDAFKAARVAERDTATTLRQATAKVQELRGSRKRLMGQLARQGVKDASRHPQAKAAMTRVRNATAKRNAAHADFKAARKARTGTSKQSLLKPNGERLTNEEIHAHMRANGVPFEGDTPLVSYLPHRPDVRGARAYFQTAFAGRRNLDQQARTGEAFRKGTHDSTYSLPAEHLLRLRGVLDRIGQHDRLVHDAAVLRQDGKAFTWDEAEAAAVSMTHDSHGNPLPGSHKLVPYRVAPGKYDSKRLQQIIDKQDPQTSPDLDRLVEADFLRRLEAPHPGDRTARNVVLLPEEITHRLEAHMTRSTDIGKAGNIATSLFRNTVLPFSVKWLVGNVTEAALRLGAVAAGPNSLRIGHKVLSSLSEMDAEAARHAEASLRSGLYFGQRGLTVTRKADQFDHTAFRVPAQLLATATRAPVVKQLGGVITEFEKGVFGLNRFMERQAQTAAIGKWSKREMQEFTGSWLKATVAQKAALEDVARGLIDTKNVHDAARYLDETLGKYQRFSPSIRKIIQSGAPFAPWYANSFRFVLWTLPAKHPIKSALMSRVEDTIDEDWKASHADVPPGSLKAAIPHKGGYIDAARYGPFGMFTAPFGGDIGDSLSFVLPQISGVVHAIQGQNFTGNKARIEGANYGDSVPTNVRLGMAVNALVEGFIPGIQILRRAQEGGSSAFDNSTVLSPKTKPGTAHGGAADRIFNPVRPVYLGGSSSASTFKPAPTVPAAGTDRLLQKRAALLNQRSGRDATTDRLLQKRARLLAGG